MSDRPEMRGAGPEGRSPANDGPSQDVPPVLERNIEALGRRRQEIHRSAGLQDRIAHAMTCTIGSMPFAYAHVLLFSGWIVANTGWLPFEPFDPTFSMLAMVASVEAIFLSTFILMHQNRMSSIEEEHAELDLQVDLLAQHEVARLTVLLSRIAEKLEVDVPPDLRREGTPRHVEPEQVLDKLEETRREMRHEG